MLSTMALRACHKQLSSSWEDFKEWFDARTPINSVSERNAMIAETIRLYEKLARDGYTALQAGGAGADDRPNPRVRGAVKAFEKSGARQGVVAGRGSGGLADVDPGAVREVVEGARQEPVRGDR